MSGAYAELPIMSPGFVGAYGKSDRLERSDLDPLPLEHEGLSTPRGEVPQELAMHEYEYTSTRWRGRAPASRPSH